MWVPAWTCGGGQGGPCLGQPWGLPRVARTPHRAPPAMPACCQLPNQHQAPPRQPSQPCRLPPDRAPGPPTRPALPCRARACPPTSAPSAPARPLAPNPRPPTSAAGKLAGLDKKLSRSLEEEVGASSSPLELSKSPVGPLHESSSRKTLVYLILTLNHIYPDYDFSLLRAHHFAKEDGVSSIEETIDAHLLEASKVGGAGGV